MAILLIKSRHHVFLNCQSDRFDLLSINNENPKFLPCITICMFFHYPPAKRLNYNCYHTVFFFQRIVASNIEVTRVCVNDMFAFVNCVLTKAECLHEIHHQLASFQFHEEEQFYHIQLMFLYYSNTLPSDTFLVLALYYY